MEVKLTILDLQGDVSRFANQDVMFEAALKEQLSVSLQFNPFHSMVSKIIFYSLYHVRDVLREATIAS